MKCQAASLVGVVACAGAFAVATAASAANPVNRFASPTGSDVAPDCTVQAHPCSLPHAISQSANGDEVTVLPGTYSLSAQVLVAHSIDIHGLAGAPRPTIDDVAGFNIPFAFQGPSTEVSYLAFNAATGDGYALDTGASIVDNVVVTGSNLTGGGVLLRAGTLRNSVVDIDSSHAAAAIDALGGTVRNVTAYATGASTVGVRADNSGGANPVALSAVNVIAHGGQVDVTASNAAGAGGATVTIDHSAFGTSTQHGTSASVTATNTVTAAPALANPAAGDFHELSGSPTIDAGVNDPANGTTDLDGHGRTLGSRTDIGAYEFVPTTPTVTTGPATMVTATSAELTATINAGGSDATTTFTLDSGPGSPRTIDGGTVSGEMANDTLSVPVAGLTPGATYTYKVTATSAAGTGVGPDVSFTTLKPAGPALSNLKPRHRRLAAGKPLAFTYTLSAPAKVTIAIVRRHHKRVLRRGSKQSGAGTGRLTLAGRRHGHALRPGSYVATATAVDAFGQRSKPRSAHFTVLAARPSR